ncbi:hypothetical protein [uncultured Acinetobacter sp.]|uniref:hypothetical protein n=1 Tax=uncultured Acinetobacter sp. TaxID=165433 RepID=UPI002590E6BA|nr:hypothetical protein [uncultured Acinetobacter sp.]
MGIKAVSFFMLVNVFYSSCIYAGVSVRGYYRSNGTYVSPHMRSNPDGNFYNNWSTIGNINPYTGKEGTKTTETTSIHNYNYSEPKTTSAAETFNTKYEVPITKASETRELSKNKNEISNADSKPIQQENTNRSLPAYLSSNSKEEKAKSEKENSWKFLTKNKSDTSYVKPGVQEYYSDGYPIISMMFTGVLKSNGRLTWLGKRFIKVKVSCKDQRIALVADAIVNSDGKVVKDIVYRESDTVKWGDISMFYNTKEFFETAKVCI